MGRAGDEGFTSQTVAPGVRSHRLRTRRFYCCRLDVVLQVPMGPGDHTRLALIARLMERGCGVFVDIPALNRYLDDLYGASFSVSLAHWDEARLLHLSLETVDQRHLPPDSAILEQAAAFLGRAIRGPLEAAEGFETLALAEEKLALRQVHEALYGDKAAYAHRRCLEETGAGAAWSLSLDGDVHDLKNINPRSLWRYYRRIWHTGTIDLYVTSASAQGALDGHWLAGTLPDRMPGAETGAWQDRPRRRAARQVQEMQPLAQARILLAYRTPEPQRGTAAWGSLSLLNAVLGADSYSRLFRRLREGEALCYHIQSQLGLPWGVLLIEAGIDAADADRLRRGVEDEMSRLRRGKVDDEDLARARLALISQLDGLDDSPGGLMRMHLNGLDPAGPGTRRQLRAFYQTATASQIAVAAEALDLDTVYLLRPAAPVL